MSSYLLSIDVLGAEGEMFGPVSPEQLSQLDRALTPAELEAVRVWQEEAAERERVGLPRSQTISVTEKGAVIAAPKVKAPVSLASMFSWLKPSTAPIPQPKPAPPPSGTDWWKVGLGVLGVGVVGLVVYKVARRQS